MPTDKLKLLAALAEQLRSALDDLGYYLVLELRKELAAQGHNLTSELSKSISHAVDNYRSGLSLSISYLKYGIYVNNGVRPERVPFGGGRSGAKTSLYIQALIDWVKERRLAEGTQAVGMAIAIARKHAKEGIPSIGSRKFSSNGRRVGFQNITIANNLDKIEEATQSGIQVSVNTTLDIIIGRITAA